MSPTVIAFLVILVVVVAAALVILGMRDRSGADPLEERLAESYMCGHTGELKLNFYTNGIQMAFEKGKIVSIEPWEQAHFEGASANLPGLTFTQLLLGYRDVDALEQAFPDIYYPKEGTKYLLGALFPRKPSWVMAFG